MDYENSLYPFVEKFLIQEKNCFSEYVGNELHLGDRRIRADVYGISADKDGNKEIYLLEGKLKLEGRRYFSKVHSEAIPLLSLADYVYIFGIADDSDFENRHKEYIADCEEKGIGILLLDNTGNISEFLKAKKNEIDPIFRKEILFRIFLKNINSPISKLIFQSCYEYIKLKTSDNCVKFIDAYDSLFSKGKYKSVLDNVLGKTHALNERGMRQEFQKKCAKTPYVTIKNMDTRYEDIICITDEGLEKIKEPILLD